MVPLRSLRVRVLSLVALSHKHAKVERITQWNLKIVKISAESSVFHIPMRGPGPWSQ